MHSADLFLFPQLTQHLNRSAESVMTIPSILPSFLLSVHSSIQSPEFSRSKPTRRGECARLSPASVEKYTTRDTRQLGGRSVVLSIGPIGTQDQRTDGRTDSLFRGATPVKGFAGRGEIFGLLEIDIPCCDNRPVFLQATER